MKRNLKFITLLIVLLLSASCAFAYDGTVVGGQDGIFERSEWISQASNINLIRMHLADIYEDWNLNKLYQITGDNADDEDYEIIDALESYIEDEYGISDNLGYSHVVLRTSKTNSEDGWFILTHYSKSEGYLHYIFYYSVSVN